MKKNWQFVIADSHKGKWNPTDAKATRGSNQSNRGGKEEKVGYQPLLYMQLFVHELIVLIVHIYLGYYKDDGWEEKAVIGGKQFQVQTQLVICQINHVPCWLVILLGWTFYPFFASGRSSQNWETVEEAQPAEVRESDCLIERSFETKIFDQEPIIV